MTAPVTSSWHGVDSRRPLPTTASQFSRRTRQSSPQRQTLDATPRPRAASETSQSSLRTSCADNGSPLALSTDLAALNHGPLTYLPRPTRRPPAYPTPAGPSPRQRMLAQPVIGFWAVAQPRHHPRRLSTITLACLLGRPHNRVPRPPSSLVNDRSTPASHPPVAPTPSQLTTPPHGHGPLPRPRPDTPR